MLGFDFVFFVHLKSKKLGGKKETFPPKNVILLEMKPHL